MTTYTVSSGQTASNITLNNGDFEYVLSGGSAVGTVVNSGGNEFVDSGATDIDTTILNGGEQFLYGTAIGTMVGTAGASPTDYDAYQIVESGGIDIGATAQGYAALNVSAGGTVSN